MYILLHIFLCATTGWFRIYVIKFVITMFVMEFLFYDSYYI